ncbi:MAG: thioesterase [Ruminococcaceae bacterium]|nr:thioesterase [Oscillospiraceae bacterium]
MACDGQLFCFTCAGGRRTLFDDIETFLPELQVEKLEYAGHGTRYREPFYRDFDALAEDMFSCLKTAYTGSKYALLGYSMGAIAVLEVLRRITASDFPRPFHIFLAAHEPRVREELRGFTQTEPDERVKQRTISFGAVPDCLISNRSFWRVYLPLYRADYAMVGKYWFENIHFETDIPATIFYSEEDTPSEYMAQWRRYFVGRFELCRFDGTHFFIREHFREMAAIIQNRMWEDK